MEKNIFLEKVIFAVCHVRFVLVLIVKFVKAINFWLILALTITTRCIRIIPVHFFYHLRLGKRKYVSMKYNCQLCKFKWEGNVDSFSEVLKHEKTHKKSNEETEGY